MTAVKKRFTDRVKHEFKDMVPVTLFFFCAFQLLALTQTLMLAQYGIRVPVFLAATFAALVVAKVVLIVDHFPFVNRFPDKPLIYNVLWKTAIYFSASLAMRYLEHFVDVFPESSGAADANRQILAGVVWPHFWALQLWLLVLMLSYCALRELVRTLGRERIIAMFFHAPSRAAVNRSGE
jgi:hypothetical protein